MLVDRLRGDLTAAMKARDATTTGALRLALAALSEAAVAGDSVKELTDAEAAAVLAKAARRHEEAAEAFAGAGRTDQAAAERASHDVMARYLPEALADTELEDLVDAVLADGGFTGPRDMGPAMKAVQARVAGRADGRAVAELVKARLAG